MAAMTRDCTDDRSVLPLPHSRRPDPPARAALDAAMRFLELVESWGRPVELAQALTQVGLALVGLRAFDAAESYFGQALRFAAMLGVADARVDLLCHLAEVACAQADAAAASDDADPMIGRRLRERARDRAYEAAGLAAQVTDAQWEVRVLLRVSDVLESCGDHDDAAAIQDRAVALLGLGARPSAFGRSELLALTAPGQLMWIRRESRGRRQCRSPRTECRHCAQPRQRAHGARASQRRTRGAPPGDITSRWRSSRP